MHFRTISSMALAVALLPQAASAGGLGVSEFSAEANGHAGAAAALATTPAVVFYNPANMTRLEGLQLELGVSALLPRWEYRPVDGGPKTTSDVELTTPPSFSATYDLEGVGLEPVAVGIGLYVPYGSSFGWPEDWAGSEIVEKLSLRIFELSPAVAVKVHEKVSIGAGFRFLWGDIFLRQRVHFGTEADGTVEVGGDGTGFGASAGLSFTPIDELAIGFSWRSQSTVRVRGSSDFDFPAPFEPLAQDRDARAPIPLAQVWRLGVAYDLLPDQLNLSADVEYSEWSRFKSLTLRLINEAGEEERIASPRNGKDNITVRVGGEYKLDDAIALRAGYIFDQRYLPESTLNPSPPDSHRHAIALGGSYDFGFMAAHLHFTNAFFVKRTTTTSDFPATYTGGWPLGTMGYAIGLSLSTAFEFADGGIRLLGDGSNETTENVGE